MKHEAFSPVLQRRYPARMGDTDGRRGTNPIDGSNLVDALSLWAAEAQVDEAARARTRERWLQQQSAEETTFVSVLADLTERGRSVLLQSSTGHSHRGVISALGVDFVALRTESGTDVLICTSTIASVRSQPGESAALSGRSVTLRLYLADAILAMAAERPRVAVTTAGGSPCNGELTSVGRDVITVRVDGDTRTNVYILIAAIGEIALAFD